MSSLSACGEGGGGGVWECKSKREKGGGFLFPLPKNGESEQSPGTVHLTLPLKEFWVDPEELNEVC